MEISHKTKISACNKCRKYKHTEEVFYCTCCGKEVNFKVNNVNSNDQKSVIEQASKIYEKRHPNDKVRSVKYANLILQELNKVKS